MHKPLHASANTHTHTNNTTQHTTNLHEPFLCTPKTIKRELYTFMAMKGAYGHTTQHAHKTQKHTQKIKNAQPRDNQWQLSCEHALWKCTKLVMQNTHQYQKQYISIWPCCLREYSYLSAALIAQPQPTHPLTCHLSAALIAQPHPTHPLTCHLTCDCTHHSGKTHNSITQ